MLSRMVRYLSAPSRRLPVESHLFGEQAEPSVPILHMWAFVSSAFQHPGGFICFIIEVTAACHIVKNVRNLEGRDRHEMKPNGYEPKTFESVYGTILDALVESQKSFVFVISSEAGIQEYQVVMAPSFAGVTAWGLCTNSASLTFHVKFCKRRVSIASRMKLVASRL